MTVTLSDGQTRSFKDAGSTGVNNPTMVAVSEARQNKLFREQAKFCLIVSLGTGLGDLTKKDDLIRQHKPAKRRWIPNPMRSVQLVKNTIENTIDELASAAANTENVHQEVRHHFEPE